MYVLDPAETLQVEANSDPIGLKVGIIYDAIPDGTQLKYQRWCVRNDATLTITDMTGESVTTFGG